MKSINSAVGKFLKQWWFAIALVVVLVVVAVFATPAGQTLASRMNAISEQNINQYLPFIATYLQIAS